MNKWLTMGLTKGYVHTAPVSQTKPSNKYGMFFAAVYILPQLEKRPNFTREAASIIGRNEHNFYDYIIRMNKHLDCFDVEYKKLGKARRPQLVCNVKPNWKESLLTKLREIRDTSTLYKVEANGAITKLLLLQ